MKNHEYFQRLKQNLAGGVHYNFRTMLQKEETPIAFQIGKGSRLWDQEGNEYLDFFAKFGAMILGHDNSHYKATLKEYIDEALAVPSSHIDVEVAELVASCIPCAERIRFGLSGTEIVQNALRVARAHTKKDRFIRFIGHYHGNSDNIMGGTMKSSDHPVPMEVKGDPRCTAGRAEGIMEKQSFIIPWNDFAFLKEVVTKYENEIAAIIMEPVCINGGGIAPKEGYLQQVRELCDQTGIVLIFDEIITGFRMGISGAQGYYNVTPDLATFGKAIAGGALPVSVLAGKAKFMSLLEEQKVVHAGTFNGYTLGLAALKATLEVLKQDGIYENMVKHMSEIHNIFITEAQKFDIPLVIQGPVSCATYHVTDTELQRSEDMTTNIAIKDTIINKELRNQGIMVSPVSRIYPNISINQDDVEFFRMRVPAALERAKKTFDDIYNV